MAEAATPASCVSPELSAGNLDSRVLSVVADNPRVLRRLVEDLGGGFRKVWYDLVGGFAEFMSPSQAHEFTSRDARDLVLALCHAQGLDVVDMGATSITAADGSRGGDPDESFLIGERATRYRRMEAAEGVDAAMESIEGQAPDLAIEVEHTSQQPGKVNVFRICGGKELWDLATEGAGRGPVIYDLQAEDGPHARAASRILPSVHAERLPASAHTLREIGGPLAFAEKRARGEPVAQRLLGVASGRSGAQVASQPDKPGSP